MAADGDKVARAYARLVGLKENLPDRTSIPQRYVEEYHQALKHLSDLGVEVSEFMVPANDINPMTASGNYVTGEVRYTKDRYVPRALLLAKLTAVLTYFSIQGPGGREARTIGFNPKGA